MTEKVLPQKATGPIEPVVIREVAIPAQRESQPSRYVSGHCAVGNCYGSKKTDPAGKRQLPACQWKYEYRGKKIVCTHECHNAFQEMLDSIQEMGGDGFTLPPELSAAASYVATIDDRRSYIPLLSVPTLTPAREFGPTPTGRAARGELTEKVRKVLVAWHAKFDELTPEIIGILIDRENPPSVGAVHAVLRKWESMSYITIEMKPFRFGVFTELGRQALVK